MRIGSILLALSTALAAAAGLGREEVVRAGRPFVQVYTDRDGLPQNSIEAMGFDARGYLWVATQDGAARFNGRAWVTEEMPQPRKGNWILDLHMGADGSRWFARSGGGISRWKGGWTTWDTTEGLPDGRVYVLKELEGRMWAGTAMGPAHLVGDRWVPLPEPGGWTHGPVRALVVHGEEGAFEVWAAADGGLGHYREGRWTWLGPSQGLPSEKCAALLEEPESGRLWVGTARGLACLEGGRWRVWKDPRDLPHPSVYRLQRTRTPEGAWVLWVGTEGGLARWEGSSRRFWTRADGLPTAVIRSLIVETDAEGRESLWIGTFGGLTRTVPGTWVSFDRQMGLPDNLVWSLAETPATRTWWFGTWTGLASFRDGRWRTHGPAEGLPDSPIFALAPDPREGPEALWLGTRGSGLLLSKAGRVTRFQGLADDWVYCLMLPEGGPERIWAGHRYGLSALVGNTWRNYGAAEGFRGGVVMSLLERRRPDGRREIWVGTRGEGLGILDPSTGAWRWLGLAEGLTDLRVMHLEPSRRHPGSVWVSTMGGGIARMDLATGRVLEVLDRERVPDLPSDLVYTLREDDRGRLFAFTHRGVAMLEREGMGWRGVVFTTGDGLPSNGCVQGASRIDARGRIWVGTVAGAAVLDPAELPADHPPRRLQVEGAWNGPSSMDHEKPLQLGWRDTRLRLAFSLLSFHRGPDCQYRTQMAGLEREPTPWTRSGEREFPTLPGGTYRFLLWGRDHEGHESGPITLTVRVATAPWLRWWAFLLYGATLLGLGAGVVAWRLARWRALNAELETKVQERTAALAQAVSELAEARDEALRANQAKGLFLATMSHEIRTPMNGVLGMASLLLGTRLSQLQREYAQVIQGAAERLLGVINEVLDFSRAEAHQVVLEQIPFHPLEEAEEVLGVLAEQGQRKGLELVGFVAPEVPACLVGDPNRLRQVLTNLLGNAVKFTARGHVALRVGVQEATEHRVTLRFEVEDTGIGIPEEARPRLFSPYAQASPEIQRRFGGTGLGLSIVRQLVTLMEGRIGVDSAEGQGTTFWLELPFRRPAQPRAASSPDLPPGTAVLALEDHPLARAALALHLQALGVQARIEADEAGLWRALQEPGRPAYTTLILELHGEAIRQPSLMEALRRQTGLPILLVARLDQLPAAEEARTRGLAEYLTAPVRRERLRQALGGAKTPPDASASLEAPRARVLVVDDDPMNRKVAVGMLQQIGCSVVAVEGGEACLAALGAEPFDWVLLDCDMPGMDGFETARRLRALPEARVGGILALTGHYGAEVREACREAGMDGYLTKPLRLEPLLAQLERGLPHAQAPADPEDLRASLARLSERLGADLVTELVEAFLDETPLRLAELEQAVAAHQVERAERLAHNLKSNAATLGLRTLSAAAGALEEEVGRAAWEGAEAALSRMGTVLPQALAALAEARR